VKAEASIGVAEADKALEIGTQMPRVVPSLCHAVRGSADFPKSQVYDSIEILVAGERNQLNLLIRAAA
jgi:hypothetical protein